MNPSVAAVRDGGRLGRDESKGERVAGAKREKTDYRGIYRRGQGYVYIWRDAHGRQRSASARTLKEARDGKSARELEARGGVALDLQRVTFESFAREWVRSYQGRGSTGFRENTRAEYQRDLERYAIAFFGSKLRVSEISPRHVARFIAWLVDDEAQRRRHAEEEAARRRDGRRVLGPPRLPLSDQTVRRIVAPLRACLATAVRDGIARSNPCTGAALPHRPRVDEDDDEPEAKVLSREQLQMFLAVVNPRYRLLFWLLAATGLRISEAVALQWKHLRLDGGSPGVRVRRAYVRGVMGPPKSRYGRREVPLPLDLADALRARKAAERPGDDGLVFPGRSGAILDQSNLRRDALVPAAVEVDADWMGFHTLRHTCASLLFDGGRNAVQVQRWLGHHSPAFTLATYVHLLTDDLGDPLELAGGSGGSIGAARGTETARSEGHVDMAKTAL